MSPSRGGRRIANTPRPSPPPPIKTRYGTRDFGGYAQAAGAGSAIKRALEERADDAKPSRGVDVILPTLLLVIGVPIEAFLLWTFHGPLGAGIGLAVLLPLQAIIFTPMMFGSVCLIAKWFEHPLGLLPTVVFKAAAMTFGPAAVADVLFITVLMGMAFDWEAVVAGFGFYLVLTGPVAAAMLGVRLLDTATLIGLIFLPRVVAAYALAFAFPALFP